MSGARWVGETHGTGRVQMDLKKMISPVLAIAIAAGSLVPLSSAANAGDRWNKRGHYGHNYHNPNVNRWGDVRHNRWNNAYNGHRYHKRDNTGRNVALGAFAVILGLALAAEANRVENQYYRD